MPRDGRPVYFCPVCSSAYDDAAEAGECEESTKKFPAPYAVGDIVTEPAKYPRYGWHDGLDHWVAKYEHPDASQAKTNSNGRDWRGSRHFYWVVTAVGTYADTHRRRPFEGYAGDHKPIYWVRTLAIKNGMPGGRGGWTSHDGHWKFDRVKNPPALVLEESRALIGFREDYLL